MGLPATRLLRLFVPLLLLSACNTVRYGQGLVQHEISINKGATLLKASGVVHELEIYDTKFRPCTLGLASMATAIEKAAAERAAERDGGTHWYTEYEWGEAPSLQCG